MSMEKSRVLLVEDESDVRELMFLHLRREGMETTAVENGEDALRMLQSGKFDLVVLDWMLPGLSGLEICKRIRMQGASGNSSPAVPILMVTARADTADIVIGLDVGADDYITKPFRLRELLVRMRAVLRRAGPPAQADAPLTVGDITLDAGRHELRKGEQAIDLTPLEFQIMKLLMQSAGNVVRRADLAIRLIETGYSGSEATMKVHIRNLRLKLEDDLNQPRYIETVFGVGYRFLEPA